MGMALSERRRRGRQFGRDLVVVCLTCVSLSGYSQQTPSLVGGTATTQSTTQPILSAPTLAFAMDPMAGVNFSACVATAAQQAAMPDPTVIQNQLYTNPQASAEASMGGILAGALGSGIGGANGSTAVSNIMSGGLQGVGMYNPNNGCPNLKKTLPSIPDKCPMIGTSYNMSEFDSLQQQLTQDEGIASCRQALSKRINTTITTCFQPEFNNLKSALNKTVKNDFDSQTTAMEQYVQQVEAKIQADTATSKNLVAKQASLNDVESSVQADYNRISGAMQGDAGTPDGATLTGLQIQNTQIKTLEATREKNIQLATPHRIYDCFTQAGAASSKILSCSDAQGNLLSPEQCIFMAFSQSVLQGRSGSIATAQGVDKTVANFDVNRAEQLLTRFLQDLEGNNPRTMDLNSWLNLHQNDLNNPLFGGLGPEITTELQNCSNDVATELTNEEQNPSSDFYKDAQAVAAARQTFMATASSMVNTLDTDTRNAYKELTGTEANGSLETAQCTSVSVTSNSTATSQGTVAFQDNTPDNALSCAQGLSATLNSMLTGQSSPGGTASASLPKNFNLMVNGQPATDPLTGQIVTCGSLRDCVLQAKTEQGKYDAQVAAMKGSGTFSDPSCVGGSCPGLKGFVNNSDQQIRSALQAVAQDLSNRVTIAQAEFQSMKNLLGLAQDGSLKFPGSDSKPKTISLDDMCKNTANPADPDDMGQICHMDNNFGDNIAGLAGVPNIQDSSFDNVTEAASNMGTEASDQLSQIQAEIRRLSAERQSCEQEKVAKGDAKKVAKIRSEYDADLAKCRTQVNSGADRAQVVDIGDRFAALETDLDRICNASAATPDDCSSLRTTLLNGSDDCMAVYNQFQKQSTTDFNNCENQFQMRLANYYNLQGAAQQKGTPFTMTMPVDQCQSSSNNNTPTQNNAD